MKEIGVEGKVVIADFFQTRRMEDFK